MSDYRSAYEKYYKNINSATKGKKDIIKHLPLSSRNERMSSGSYGINGNLNNQGKNYIVRRVIRELVGSVVLLLLFFCMKVIPLKSVNNMHAISKQVLGQNFNYDSSIEAFNAMEVGKVKMKDLNISNFKIEDLKSDNLKLKTSEFIKYLKDKSGLQLKNND